MTIQIFKNKESQKTPYQIELLTFLTSDRWRAKVQEVRDAPDKATRDKLKGNLPCAIPSLLYDGSHSGLITIDLDAKDNPTWTPLQMKQLVSKIANVFYCGYSCSGAGVWALIPIAEPDKHLQHFKALKRVFSSIGLSIDVACSNVNRLRYVSYDAEPYINQNAVPFVGLYEEPKPEPKPYISSGSSDDNIFEEFNQRCDVPTLLVNHGWTIVRQKGSRVMMRRPDKSEGASGEWSTEKRLFLCYSSSTQFEVKKGYFAVQVLMLLEGLDKKECAKRIKQLLNIYN